MGRRNKPVYYTLVQHSGFTSGGDAEFAQAVELRVVETTRDTNAVARAGGLMLENYRAAADREEAENYPPDVRGLIPRVRGTFSRVRIGGQRVYVPAPADAKKESAA